jgi:hypothetical protein
LDQNYAENNLDELNYSICYDEAIDIDSDSELHEVCNQEHRQNIEAELRNDQSPIKLQERNILPPVRGPMRYLNLEYILDLIAEDSKNIDPEHSLSKTLYNEVTFQGKMYS